MKNELDLRIEKIESKLSSPAGTCISRTLLDDSNGLKWVIGFGQMSMPKSFFYGHTIEECIEKAEKVFNESKTRICEPHKHKLTAPKKSTHTKKLIVLLFMFFLIVINKPIHASPKIVGLNITKENYGGPISLRSVFVDGCKYIVTIYIGHNATTTHAGDCPNPLYKSN